MHWDGASWSVVPSPNVSADGNRLRRSRRGGLERCLGGWLFGHCRGKWETLAEHWDGTAWSVVRTPNNGSDSEFTSVVALSPGSIWAVGLGGNQALTENGSLAGWQVVATPPLVEDAHLQSVSATPTGTLWAVGGQSQDVEQLFLMMAP
jgi:hypothetical protein